MADKRASRKGYKYKDVWKSLSTSDWSSLLERYSPGSGWQVKGKNLVGHSPYSPTLDNTPSCHIVTGKGFIKCFSTGVFEADPIKFLAKIADKDWSSVALDLKRIYRIKSISNAVTEELQKREEMQKTREATEYALCISLRMAAEAALGEDADPTFNFAQPCLDYLRKRGVLNDTPCKEDIEILRNLPIGIVPPIKIINEVLGVESDRCREYLKQWTTAEYTGSLAFIYHNTPTEISAIKLRADFLRPDGRKDFVKVSDQSNDVLGFFGLKHYRAKLGTNSSINSNAMIVEGEFDSISNMVYQLKAGMQYDIVLSTGGAAESNLDRLKDFGIKTCLLTADSPEHNGDLIVKNLLRNNKIPMHVFTWPEHIAAKDPDEAIAKHGGVKWLDATMARSTDGGHRRYYQYAYQWVLERLHDRLSSVDRDDLRAVREVIIDEGSCLLDPSEQAKYVEEASILTDITKGEISALIIGQEESEEGYVRRLTTALRNIYMFIGTESSGGIGRILAWHKVKREMRSWNASRAAELQAALSSDLGNITFWAKDHVGVPTFLSQRITANGIRELTLLEQQALQEKYIKIAVEEIIKEMSPLSELKELKAGCHYIPHKDENGIRNRWCIVNGNDVYVGTETGEESKVMRWNRLDGPKLGKYYFNLIRPSWSEELQSVSDLLEGNVSELPELYEFLVEVISTGWCFKHQSVDCQYLAAAIMLNPVCSALPRQLYTIINGTRGSGKSSFLGLLTGADGDHRLLESAFGMDNYTTAGFRKEMNNCSLGAVLDEFEDTGSNAQSAHVRGILRDVRSLTSNPEARIVRGNIENKEVTAYTLRCQLWCAAIQYLRDEADVSRFIQIHTVLREGHPNPKVVLREKYGSEMFKNFRRRISTGMFRHTPELLKNINELRVIYSNPSAMNSLGRASGVEIPSRFLDGVLIAAAMIWLAGRNPHTFIRAFVIAKSEYLKKVIQGTQKHALFEHILSAPIEYSRPTSEIRHSTVRSILSDPSERGLLNETESGVRYVEFSSEDGSKDYRWLVVIWADALHGVLRGVSTYRRETPNRLKQLADSDVEMIVPDDAVRRVPGGIKRFLKVGVNASDYTVYNVDPMLKEWDTGVTR